MPATGPGIEADCEGIARHYNLPRVSLNELESVTIKPMDKSLKEKIAQLTEQLSQLETEALAKKTAIAEVKSQIKALTKLDDQVNEALK